MYKSVEQYLGSDKNRLLMNPYGRRPKKQIKENFQVDLDVSKPENPGFEQNGQSSAPRLRVKWTTQEYTHLSDPRVWGPPFWFSLHTSAANYPEKASHMVRDLMVGRLLALPVEIPCASCRPHASAFIEANKHKLPDICSGRDSLFNFYVDFHNKVNQRHNKKVLSYDEARTLWMNGISISTMRYTN